jgi:hypothetical protein
MTREDIIRMAREADIEFDLIDEDEGQIWYITSKGLERFAALVAAASEAKEREAIVEEAAKKGWAMRNEDAFEDAVREIAAIRAKGQE